MHNLPTKITLMEAQEIERKVSQRHEDEFRMLQRARGIHTFKIPAYHVSQKFTEISANVQRMETEIKRMYETRRELENTVVDRAQAEILNVAQRLCISLDSLES